MTKLRVNCFAISVDGFGAGPEQDLDNPMGRGGMGLHQWAFETRTFRRMFGQEGGSTGIDDGFAVKGFENLGAWILGRNMFGPVRGDWGDESWKGWWGDTPPYHVPVYVLTHYARPDLVMNAGTTFHFVTGGFEEALRRAREAAAGKDIRVGGGAATIRQYLSAGLMDEMHVAISPVLLGRGEPVFGGLDLPALGYRVTQQMLGEKAMHVVIGRG